MLTAKRIKTARVRLQESQEMFGKRFNVDQSTIHRWETDGPPKHPLVVPAIEQILNSIERATPAPARVAS